MVLYSLCYPVVDGSSEPIVGVLDPDDSKVVGKI
jgi:hypothetical protein